MKVRFQRFELDTVAFELRHDGERVHLERRPMEALVYLIERRGELVTREDLIEKLWGKGVVIEFDAAVNTLARKIRQALEDSSEHPVFLETVARKGYRFIAAVQDADATPAADATAAGPPARGLRPIAWAGVAVLAIALGAWALFSSRPHEPLRIAVMPFDTFGAADRLEYLGHGLAEDTSASLAQLDSKRLEVVGPMSTLSALDAGKDLPTLSRKLKLDYAVQGTLRVEGTSVRVTANLVRVDDPAPMWSATFDRELTSVLGLQRELSAAIARQVHLHVSPEREAALARRHTDDAAAYDLYLRGRHAWRQLNPIGNRDATRYYLDALDVDPEYALAWAGLALIYSAAAINSDADPSLLRDRARTAAVRALQHGPDLAEAQFAAAYVNFWLDPKWNESLAHARRAAELDPSHGGAHMLAGHLLSQMDEQVEARALLQRARELDPLFAMTYAMSSQVAFQAREFGQAREFARQAIAIAPDFWIAHMQHGQVLEQLGEWNAALDALEKSTRLSGGNSKPVALRAYTLARMGRADEAREVLTDLEVKAKQTYVPPYAFAIIHAGLRNEAETREWLENALAGRDPHLGFITVDPKWDEWRHNAWFANVIEGCDFER